VNTHERFSNRLRRCRQSGIRAPRGEMVYDHRACSGNCANNLWFRYAFDSFVGLDEGSDDII
jgi:hypothetical protein